MLRQRQSPIIKGPCMVLAGPGSGKTLTIAKRIEYLIMKHKVRPEEILVITFTKYAAWEMKEQDPKYMWSFFLCCNIRHVSWNLLWNSEMGVSPEPVESLTDEEKYRMLRNFTRKLTGIRNRRQMKKKIICRNWRSR